MSDAEVGSSCGTDSVKLDERLKVLCLHGYRQNGQSFKSKLGSFRKYVNKYADLVFMTAPHAVPVSGFENNCQDDSDRSWWFNKDDGTFEGKNDNGPAIGFEQSLKEVEKIWTEQGPFHGILGFSQGACFAGLLCLLSVKSFTTVTPRFAILSSGFRSGSLIHKNLFEESVQIPTLHIFGEADEIIPPKMSESLALSFYNPEILRHSGGHYFPATSQQKQTYIDFMRDRLVEFLENKEINEGDNYTVTVETK